MHDLLGCPREWRVSLRRCPTEQDDNLRRCPDDNLRRCPTVWGKMSPLRDGVVFRALKTVNVYAWMFPNLALALAP